DVGGGDDGRGGSGERLAVAADEEKQRAGAGDHRRVGGETPAAAADQFSVHNVSEATSFTNSRLPETTGCAHVATVGHRERSWRDRIFVRDRHPPGRLERQGGADGL